MPFGVTAAVTSGLIAAGVGEVTAGILAAGLVSAGTGALIGGATAALTGGNIGKGMLYGGVGGAFTGGIGGALGGAGGTAADEAAFMAGDEAADAAAGVGGAGAVGGVSGLPSTAAIDSLGSNIGANSAALGTSTGGSNVGSALSGLNSPALQSAAGAPSSSSGGILDWLGKSNNLKTVASLGNAGLSLAQALNPKTVNPQATADAARAAAGMNGVLPKYTLQNSSTPYTGNWYTYGQTPQTAMYSASLQPVAQKQGGLVGYAHGGRVGNYAMGGMPPQTASPLAAMASPQVMPSQNPAMGAKPPINPLATHNGFAIGKALGQQLKATGKLHNLQTPKDAFQVGHAIGSKLANNNKPAFAGDGRVPGQGGGQDDTVHAKLSKDEFVIPAEVVSQLGDGSSEHGGKVLEQFIHNVREQKTKNRGKFPPKARNPLSYLPKGALA